MSPRLHRIAITAQTAHRHVAYHKLTQERREYLYQIIHAAMNEQRWQIEIEDLTFKDRTYLRACGFVVDDLLVRWFEYKPSILCLGAVM
jgi:hypothetical protein